MMIHNKPPSNGFHVVNGKLPFVSLLIVVRNEAVYIARCLQAVIAQDYLGNIEILVVDGVSTDDTRDIVQKYISHYPATKIKLLENPGKIVPIGMNIALRQAKGDILIRVDGHCIIMPDYVRKCVEHIQKNGVDGVGGSMETIGETRLAQVIAIGMSSRFGVGNSNFRTLSGKNMLVDTVPFPAYTREIIEKVGLYDEELVRNQDDEYNYRIRDFGGNILLADDIHSTYFSRSSLIGLWKQYFQYGFWKVRVFQKHPRQMRPRQFIPFLFVFTILVSVFLLFIPAFRFFALIVPFSYLLVNLLASLKAMQNGRMEYFSLLPAIYTILHVSYGVGFLIGLFVFANRWRDKVGKTPMF